MPQAAPLRALNEITLQLDEYEALKLADLQKKGQLAAAVIMKVSRQTFGTILASARGKLAEAVVKGKALRLAGGPVTTHYPPPCVEKTNGTQRRK